MPLEGKFGRSSHTQASIDASAGSTHSPPPGKETASGSDSDNQGDGLMAAEKPETACGCAGCGCLSAPGAGGFITAQLPPGLGHLDLAHPSQSLAWKWVFSITVATQGLSLELG